jgi:hypothetical protein
VPDADLRKLERDAHGGDADAQARLLAERVRRGLLQPERQRVAALLGVGDDGTASLTGWAWLAALAKAGPEAGLRTALAGAAHVQPVWERGTPEDDRFAVGLAACEAWLLRPNADSRRIAVEAALQLPDPSPISYPPNRAARALRFVGRAIEADGEEKRLPLLLDGLRFAHQTSTSNDLRAAIIGALLPWACGDITS